MKTLWILFGLILLLTPACSADSTQESDTVVMADLRVRSGRILSINATDLLLQENPRSNARMIPLAEVKQIKWRNGDSRLFHPAQDPLSTDPESLPYALRSSGYFRHDDLVLSRGEILESAFLRGLLAGTVATFFGSDGDEKKIAFGIGFTANFCFSLYLGW